MMSFFLFFPEKAHAQVACAPNAFINGTCTAVNTAVGTIYTTPGALINSVFTIILSISGGIALLLIIFAGFRIIFSQGNPEQITAAKDRLYSAITGLLFIIFSLVILEVIGVDVLKIPQFRP